MSWTGGHRACVARLRLAMAAGVFVCALSLAPQVAAAETKITGDVGAVRLEARRSSLEEVFAALAAQYHVRYHSKVALDRPVNGVFSGSLSRVVARLLDGYDHVVKRGPDGIVVTILGVSPRTSAPGEPT